MQAVIRLSFEEKFKDFQNEMTTASADEMEAHLKAISALADGSKLPLASVSKSKACALCAAHLLKVWTPEESQTFLFQLRMEVADCEWTPEKERNILLQTPKTTSEAIALLDRTLQTPLSFVGVPCRLREFRKTSQTLNFSHTNMPTLWLRQANSNIWISSVSKKQIVQPKGFETCNLFCAIPTTSLVVGLSQSSNMLAIGNFGDKKKIRAKIETSVKGADFVECEIVPSGAILLCVGKRNEDTGGLLQAESMAFRIDDNENLSATVLTEQEVKDAERESQQPKSLFNFARVGCPLAAHMQNPWRSRIVFQDDVVFENENHGTVLGMCGQPNEFQLAHASGLVVHVKNGIVAREDIGFACDACVALQF